jgi:energy-coupling factor transporter ATP-binding protein EcfA2
MVPPLLPAQTQVDLLAALDSVQRCLIVGPSDSGKTTLLQWLISRRSQTSKSIVIDPHGWPDKWPSSTVVGTGRNYIEIDRALDALVRLMTKRYDEIGKGMVVEGMHPRVTILIDEWRAIVYNVKGASEAIKALLTESRKAAFSVFVASHSDRAKPLGLEGEYDLKDGFAVVRLAVVNGQRQATLDTGNGEAPATLPGPFVGSIPQVVDIDRLTFTEADLEPEPTVTETHIMQLYGQGESFNEIARQVFGNTGGKQTKRIKEILQKFDQL